MDNSPILLIEDDRAIAQAIGLALCGVAGVEHVRVRSILGRIGSIECTFVPVLFAIAAVRKFWLLEWNGA
jgi:hypothetical protein